MAQINIEDAREEREIRDQECAQETENVPEADETAAGEQTEEISPEELNEEADLAETSEETGEEAEAGTEEKEAGEGEEASTREEACDQAEADAGQKEGGIKGFFRKKDKKDKKDQQIEELTDRVKRQMAEFDNFRKRTEKEKAAMYEIGAKSVIEKILPVVDNFERGLATEENKEDPFVEGMQKIYKQLMTTLESLDVKPIDAVGKEFNPDLHNAVMHVDDENVGENIVVEELQKGYMYRDSVVRYSMVKVAN
ncbi:MAG: nucleotide exchange factor GrpE [Lachnospiraceae bacterium]|nr:nucleotide exchange factor GrpE [Lachnospiraceae bacterium]